MPSGALNKFKIFHGLLAFHSGIYHLEADSTKDGNDSQHGTQCTKNHNSLSQDMSALFDVSKKHLCARTNGFVPKSSIENEHWQKSFPEKPQGKFRSVSTT